MTNHFHFMADHSTKNALLSVFSDNKPLSIHEIQSRLPNPVAQRTLRRWLAEAVERGMLLKLGQKRATQYAKAELEAKLPTFLNKLPEHKQQAALKQLRDLWTHTSTAIEGNTLSLGDTHFILEEGLTISGKPIREHQEIIGHASAIELIYLGLDKPLTKQLCFNLHKAIQTEVVNDIYKPYGAWKVSPNGTYTIGTDDQPIYLEYAQPQFVEGLMKVVIDEINRATELNLKDAHRCYAKIHAAIAHIHPFWDGNGRIARLLANFPLLKSGLPPIVIHKEARRHYIQLLAKYELQAGTLTAATGPWPKPELLKDFEAFCADCYAKTQEILKL